ncbi:MAG: alpha-rhamnosidase [Prevotella sp.]|nr:alpha-rhamnosidase [Prevotella sp.]
MAKTHNATWIWYPGDYEVWLGNRFNNNRTERGAMFPPFWKQDSHWVTVEFSKAFTLENAETISIATEGKFNVMLDGKLLCGMPKELQVPAGEHTLNFKIYNQTTPPALYVAGKTINTDSTWLATYEDKIWIDENGTAHGSGIYVHAASWNFDSIDTPPSLYRLEREEWLPTASEKTADDMLYDFGKETFGYLKLKGTKGKGHINIFYGESREEALDSEHCETLDMLETDTETPQDIELENSKAFRYVCIKTDKDVTFESLAMDFEFAPFDKEKSGTFRCNDDLINRIWETGAYTMDLTTREFFIDGIKRDRWVWSGDAMQSYLMNYYLRFDTDCVRRTIRQLRGKNPVTAHINTIMDYTFYWFKSIHDYYMYTADLSFVREVYPLMQTMMHYVLGRTNADGMAEGQADDWIFVDWVDFPMHKRGTLCFEQILLCKALEAMSLCAAILRDNPLANPPQGSIETQEYAADAKKYGKLAKALFDKLKPTFWDESRKAFMHAIEDGEINPQITKFPNMFAIIYGYLSEEDRQTVMQSVMLNPEIEKITTPYMRFYELEALCLMGMQEKVMQEIRDYWGGMLAEGATSFWEKYNPEDHGTQHLAMYGRPYGKSLCHAWGASPIYLLGRYCLGVEPVKAGYEEYVVRPSLGGLEWIEGDVPTQFGKIHVRMTESEVVVYSDGGQGTLIVGDKQASIEPNKETRMTIKT